MKYKAVFFDLDGTLMDTSDGIYAGGRYAMEKVGIPITENANWGVFIGPPLGDCFRLAFHVRDESKIEPLCDAYHEFYEREGLYRARFYPGIPEVIRTLRERGYILGIASMKNEDLVRAMCVHFGVAKDFQIQLGIDLVGTMTKADLLKKGFEELGLEPSDCVLVGDTVFDEKGALGAGCDIIKAAWGFGFTDKDEGAVSDPLDILKLV